MGKNRLGSCSMTDIYTWPHRRQERRRLRRLRELTVRSVHDSATAAPAFRDRGATVAFLHR